MEHEVIFLKGPRIILRPLTPDDDILVNVWINDPEIRIYLSVYLPQALDNTRAFREHVTQKNSADIVLMIVVDGRPIGITSLHVNYKDRHAASGAYIGVKEYQNQGYGSESKMLMLRYAFHTLDLCKVKSSVIAFNKRSYAYLTKCGYKKIGVEEKDIYIFGRHRDRILLVVWREDWEKLWKRFAKKHKIIDPVPLQ